MEIAETVTASAMAIPLDETPRVNLDDAELVALSRGDDRDAFGQLVDRHKDRVVNYLTRLTGNRDRAEDFAQETFIRLFQNLDRYRDEGALVAYLLRIATNLVRSEERRRSRWRVLRPLFAVTGFRGGMGRGAREEDPEASPQNRALASEETRQVSAAIASLDLRYRAPLVMREIEGATYQEIAIALGVNEGTVKSRLHRGRHLLKEKLTPYWNGGHHDG